MATKHESLAIGVSDVFVLSDVSMQLGARDEETRQDSNWPESLEDTVASRRWATGSSPFQVVIRPGERGGA